MRHTFSFVVSNFSQAKMFLFYLEQGFLVVMLVIGTGLRSEKLLNNPSGFPKIRAFYAYICE